MTEAREHPPARGRENPPAKGREHPPAEVRLIPAGYEGTLHAGQEERIPVRVFERGTDVLMLVVLLDADTGIPPAPVDPVLVEYTSAHGLVRLRGRASLERPDLIRFSAVEPAECLQRREFVRVDAYQAVELDGEGDGAPARARAVDLSGGGMLLDGVDPLEEGRRIGFRLDLGQGEAPIRGTARVVRTDGHGQAVVFESIAEAERQRLVHFVFTRQREVLARIRGRAGKTRRTA